MTKEFVRQGTPLSPLELFATWSIVKQLGAREKHVGFFNCGPESGASYVQAFNISTCTGRLTLKNPQTTAQAVSACER